MHIIKHTFVVYVITFMVGCGGSSNNSTDETPECVDCTPGVNDPAFLEVNLKEADSSLFLTTDELYDFDLVSENVSVADGQRTFDQQGMKLTSNTNDLSEKDFSVLSHAILRQPITFDSATIIEQEFLLENYDSTAITGDGCDFQLSFGAFSGGSRGACVARSNYEPRDRIEKFQTVVMPNSPGYFGVWHTVYKAQLEANETATSTYSSLSFRVVNPKEPVWNTLTRSVFLFSSSGFAQGKATQNRGQWSHKGIKEMLLLPPSISEENTWDINNSVENFVTWESSFPENSIEGQLAFDSNYLPQSVPVAAEGDQLNQESLDDQEFQAFNYYSVFLDLLFSPDTTESIRSKDGSLDITLRETDENYFINDIKVASFKREKYYLSVTLENGAKYNFHGSFYNELERQDMTVVSSPDFGLKVGVID